MPVFALITGAFLYGISPDAGLAQTNQRDEHPLLAQVRQQLDNPNAPFVMVVSLKTRKGEHGAFETAFVPAIQLTRKERGCLAYVLSRSRTQPESYILYEHWNNLEDLKAHLESPHVAELLRAIDPLSAEPPRIEVYVPLKDD